MVRIDEIPVRGLKPVAPAREGYAAFASQNRRNPRQGIETYTLVRPSGRFYLGQNRRNPRQGIET